jgi:Tfp pilus assembly protein PilF
MKKFVKHGITVIGIAVLVFLAVGSGASAPSANKEAVVHYNNGLDSYKKQDYNQAIAEFTEAIQRDPNFTNAYYNRGRAYDEINDFDRAIADYDKTIQLNPKATNAYNNRAWIYAYKLKTNFGQAINDANQAINLNPRGTYFDTRGWAYLGNGDYDKAIADFEMALKFDSNMTSSKDGLARARQANPNNTSAILVQAQPQNQARQAVSTPQTGKDEDFEIKQNRDNTITITNYKGTIKNLIIPDTLYGLKVTIIGNRAFMNKGLISVVIPDTVITIEDGGDSGARSWFSEIERYLGAFLNNKELIKVTLGTGLKTIGNNAFYSCQLTEIIIPDSVIAIGDSAFYSSGLIKVTFGKGLQTIGKEAFSSNQIAEINLPSSLKEIGAKAFYENKIKKLTLPAGLQTVAVEVFSHNQITELNLPSSLKRIEKGAFANNQIQSIIIPNGVTELSSYNRHYSVNIEPFQNNPLTSVVIPASLINGIIGSFVNNSTITRITIPAGMKEYSLNGVFEEAFVNFWISQNRAGGTYVKRGPIWTKE